MLYIKPYIMKKTITRVFGAVAILLLFTISAKAQDKAAEGAKAVTNHMKEQLSLNDSQYTKYMLLTLIS
jgi:hypothetical protein